MKRSIITTLISVAFIMMAFVSCQKDFSVAQEESTIVFHSTRPQLDIDSKTVWNGEKIQWADKDAIRMAYMVDGNWQNATGNVSDGGKAKFYASKSTTLSDDSMTAEFEISGSFTGASEGQHNFFALYPSTAYDAQGTDINPNQVPIALPSEQACSWIDATSVLSFDSSADLMYGVSVGEYNTRPTSVDISWQRLVAHAYITLKDLKDVTAGEIISSITLTANDGAALAGTYKMNLEDGSLTPSETTNTIVVDGKNLNISEGDVVFWACMMPCTWTSLKVVVETDKATYTRNIDLSSDQKTFLQNRRNLLRINMADAVRTPKAVSTAYYEKVTSAPADWKGEYLIVVYTSEKYYVFDQKNTGTWGTVTLIEESDGKIELSTTIGDFAITIEDGTTEDTYSIKLKDNTYISGGAKDKLNVLENNTSTKTDMNISINDDKTINIQSVYKTDATRRIQSGSGGIRFYDDNTKQPLPFLYKLVNNN